MIIVGAKGFAKQLVEIFFQSNKIEDLFFFDDFSKDIDSVLFGIKILKNIEDVMSVFQSVSNEFCLGLGNPQIREKMVEKFEYTGGKLCSVISPHSHISSFVHDIGQGCNILTGAVIENDVHIEKGVLINVNAVVNHDTYISEYCEISPGAKLLGNVRVEKKCIIGANAVILSGINIGTNVIIGAGAVVTKDVSSNKTMVGVPARELK